MDPILNMIEAFESREDGASLSYRKVANKFGVDRTMLSRRHWGVRGSNEEMGKAQQLLSPQQELELVQYIERCTGRGLPPTREMVQISAAQLQNGRFCRGR
jgi:transposase-like protein